MLNSIEGNKITTVCHKKFFNASKNWLSDDEFQPMVDELNQNLDIVINIKYDNSRAPNVFEGEILLFENRYL